MARPKGMVVEVNDEAQLKATRPNGGAVVQLVM
jgi:hypothetical protein